MIINSSESSFMLFFFSALPDKYISIIIEWNITKKIMIGKYVMFFHVYINYSLLDVNYEFTLIGFHY